MNRQWKLQILNNNGDIVTYKCVTYRLHARRSEAKSDWSETKNTKLF